MDILSKQIGVARGRLNLTQFLHYLGPACAVWLAMALVAIVVGKVLPVRVSDRAWNVAWLVGALIAGVVTAVIWTRMKRRSDLEAALEIDQRFGLKERVSSALAMDAIERETPAGQALITDAARRIAQLDLGDRFSIKPAPSAWWPLVPGGLALLIALVVSQRVPEKPAAAATTTTSPEEIKKSAKELEKKLAEHRAEAKKQDLKEADALLKKLEEGTKEIANKSSGDKQQALTKLNDLAKELESRRQKLGGDDQFKQQLNSLKDLKKGPADAAAKAMKNGDFGQAAKELEKITKQLAAKELSEQEKQQLAEQLRQMHEGMKKAAEAHQQAEREIEKQLAQARESKNHEEAEKLQQQLEKLRENNAPMQALEQLASECKACSEAMKSGDSKQAQQALDQLSKNLKEMQRQQQEMTMLDDALEQIGEAKQCMAGDCDRPGQNQGMKAQQQSDKPGKEVGHGRGHGVRGPNDPKTGFYDSAVKQDVSKGGGVVTDMVEGPNRKGEVTESVKAAFEAAKKESADPLTGERLPRDYRDHAKEYFDAFRKGRGGE
jgi:chemotaxis protein histidine kinase CheA